MRTSSKPLNQYLVTFAGVYLGGEALVWANDSGHAKRLLTRHLENSGDFPAYRLYKFQIWDVKKIEQPSEPTVLVVDNGDY